MNWTWIISGSIEHDIIRVWKFETGMDWQIGWVGKAVGILIDEVAVVSSIPSGGNFIFADFWNPVMSILYKNARNVRFVLFRKNSNISRCSVHLTSDGYRSSIQILFIIWVEILCIFSNVFSLNLIVSSWEFITYCCLGQNPLNRLDSCLDSLFDMLHITMPQNSLQDAISFLISAYSLKSSIWSRWCVRRSGMLHHRDGEQPVRCCKGLFTSKSVRESGNACGIAWKGYVNFWQCHSDWSMSSNAWILYLCEIRSHSSSRLVCVFFNTEKWKWNRGTWPCLILRIRWPLLQLYSQVLVITNDLHLSMLWHWYFYPMFYCVLKRFRANLHSERRQTWKRKRKLGVDYLLCIHTILPISFAFSSAFAGMGWT